MNQAKSDGKSPLRVPVIVLAVVVTILLASAAFEIGESAKGPSYDYDFRDYLYPAEMERFGDLYGVAISDMRRDASYTTEVSECRALAFYYEQAVLEHAYRTTGENDKADKFAARMQEYEGQLGSLSAKAKAVREAVSAGSEPKRN